MTEEPGLFFSIRKKASNFDRVERNVASFITIQKTLSDRSIEEEEAAGDLLIFPLMFACLHSPTSTPYIGKSDFPKRYKT